MGLRRKSSVAFASILSLIIIAGMPGTALAGGHRHHTHKSYDPSVGCAVPIQNVYQFPAAIVFQPTRPTGYAVPIQNAYQFPAMIVSQPSAFEEFSPLVWVAGPVPGYHLLP
jgi:hypothetical protein